MLEIERYDLPEVDSTQDWPKSQLDALPRDKLVVIAADRQSAGRGQFKRRWISPPGCNLYVSFCYYLPRLTPAVTHLSNLLALAASEVLRTEGFPVSMKFPNDLMINGKKVAGVLTEISGLRIISGIGLNVNMTQSDLDLVDQPATSLLVESGKQQDRDAVCGKLIARFQAHLIEFFRDLEGAS